MKTPSRTSTASEHATSYELDLLRNHKKNPNSVIGAKSLEKLIEIHSGILSQIAISFSRQYPHVGSYEDFFQEAHLAALVAYSRFSEEKSYNGGIRLYLRSIVFRELLSYVSDSGLIRINSHNRAIKNYITGKYNDQPEKLRSFELKHGINSPQERADFQFKYRMLGMQLYSLDALSMKIDDPDSLSSSNSSDEVKSTVSKHQLEESRVQSIDLQRSINNLDEVKRDIVVSVYVFEETLDSIAKRLELSVGAVKYALQRAKKELEESLS